MEKWTDTLAEKWWGNDGHMDDRIHGTMDGTNDSNMWGKTGWETWTEKWIYLESADLIEKV